MLYQQDCEFYRYQDSLRWSRFRTITAIEGSWLYFVYSDLFSKAIVVEKNLILLAGALLILAICLLSCKDMDDAQRHLDRLKTFEIGNPLPGSGRIYKILKGNYVMIGATIFINVFNLLVLTDHWL